RQPLPKRDAVELLVLRALEGHGFATARTIAATWRLRRGDGVAAALASLVEAGRVAACTLVGEDGRRTPGWVLPRDLELAAALGRARPRADRAVLLSPFDP